MQLRLKRRQWETLGNALLANLRGRTLGADLNSINLTQAIVDQATAQGVPPAIALAVAMQESGIQQWRANGQLVTGTSGEIGVFQLMPSTATQLGVDPADPLANIDGGIRYLASLYSQFGQWPLALVAYNWGPGNLQKYLSSGQGAATFNRVAQNYAAPILAASGAGAAVSTFAAGSSDQGVLPIGNQSSNLPVTLGIMAAAALGLKWLLND